MLERVIEKDNAIVPDAKAKPTTVSHEGWQYKEMLKQHYYDTEKRIEVIICYDCMYVPALDRYAWTKRP